MPKDPSTQNNHNEDKIITSSLDDAVIDQYHPKKASNMRTFRTYYKNAIEQKKENSVLDAGASLAVDTMNTGVISLLMNRNVYSSLVDPVLTSLATRTTKTAQDIKEYQGTMVFTEYHTRARSRRNQFDKTRSNEEKTAYGELLKYDFLTVADKILNIPRHYVGAKDRLKDSLIMIAERVKERHNRFFPEPLKVARIEGSKLATQFSESNLINKKYKNHDEMLNEAGLEKLREVYSQKFDKGAGDLLCGMISNEFKKAYLIDPQGSPQINPAYSLIKNEETVNEAKLLEDLTFGPDLFFKEINKALKDEVKQFDKDKVRADIPADISTAKILGALSDANKNAEALLKETQKIEKAEDIEQVRESLAAGAQAISSLGRIFNIEEAQAAGQIAEKAINLGATLATLSLGAINPAVAIAGVLGVVADALDIFKRKSQGPSETFLLRKEIHLLSKQLHDYFLSLMESVSGVNDNVIKILNELTDGLEFIASEFQLDRAISRYNQQRNERIYNQIVNQLGTGFHELWTQKILQRSIAINTYNKGLSNLPYEDFESHSNEFNDWLLGMSSAAFSSGEFIYPDDDQTPVAINKLISKYGSELSVFPQFLVKFAKNQLGVSLDNINSNPIPDNPGFTVGVPNPSLWLKIAHDTIYLRRHMPDQHIHKYDPKGTQLDHFSNMARHGESFYRGISSNNQLFDSLWQRTLNAISNVAMLIENEHELRNAQRKAERIDGFGPFNQMPSIKHEHSGAGSHMFTFVISDKDVPRANALAPLLSGATLNLPNDLSILEKLSLGRFSLTIHHLPIGEASSFVDKISVSFDLFTANTMSIPVCECMMTRVISNKIDSEAAKKFKAVEKLGLFAGAAKLSISKWMSSSVAEIKDLTHQRSESHHKAILSVFKKYYDANLLSSEHIPHLQFESNLQELDMYHSMLRLYLMIANVPDNILKKAENLPNSLHITRELHAELMNPDLDIQSSSATASSLQAIVQVNAPLSFSEFIREHVNEPTSIYTDDFESIISAFDSMNVVTTELPRKLEAEPEIIQTSSGSSLHSRSSWMSSLLFAGEVLRQSLPRLEAIKAPPYTRSYGDIVSDYSQSFNEQLPLLHLIYHGVVAPLLPSNQKRELTLAETNQLIAIFNSLPALQKKCKKISSVLKYSEIEDQKWLENTIDFLKKSITATPERNTYTTSELNTVFYKHTRAVEIIADLELKAKDTNDCESDFTSYTLYRKYLQSRNKEQFEPFSDHDFIRARKF